MNRQEPHLDPELDALLEVGRFVPPVPEIVRVRTLSRARATVAAMAILPREPISTVRRRGLPLALAASLALATGAAVATAALLGRAPSSGTPAPPAIKHPEQPMHPDTLEVPPPSPMVEPTPTFTSKPQRSPRPTSAQESYAAELDLLARCPRAGRRARPKVPQRPPCRRARSLARACPRRRGTHGRSTQGRGLFRKSIPSQHHGATPRWRSQVVA